MTRTQASLFDDALPEPAPDLVVKLVGAIYVLHVFQKKSKHGIATPKHVVELVQERLKRAVEDHAERFGKKGRKK